MTVSVYYTDMNTFDYIFDYIFERVIVFQLQI